MILLLLLELFYVLVLTKTSPHSHSPRMFIKDEGSFKRFRLTGQNLPVQLLREGQPNAVTSVGKTHLYFYNFNDTDKDPEGQKVVWKDSKNNINTYDITLVHEREEGKPLFVCGTNSEETKCCEMDLSDNSCVASSKMENIGFIIKDGEHLVENENGADVYLTYSGAQEHVGIHKFGSKRVRPAINDKEQYYVGLVLNKRKDDKLQSRVYAFYKQKNTDTDPWSDMWLPFVSQVCMEDAGGPKNNLQFSWTSLMNAKLYCGYPDSKQHFSELVDVATVHTDRWQDTRVYALFRNEWGMSAVCVYTIGDIDNVFTYSPFKGSTADTNEDKERKKCVSDSTKIPSKVLTKIKEVSEMKEWVQPVNKLGPVLFKHHNYTQISVDASLSQHTVMFLSLDNGAIHKVLQWENHSFVIAEYQPFNHSSHILRLVLHPSSRKLYVNSKTELVQIDVGNCHQYGNTCQECHLSRDPYCTWTRERCTSKMSDSVNDVASGNTTMCVKDQTLKPPPPRRSSAGNVEDAVTGQPADKNVVSVPAQSSFILRCPVTSHHAHYTWDSPQGLTRCHPQEGQCLYLIESMTAKQVGEYKCESEERGHRKVLAQYQLRSRAAGKTFPPIVWACFVSVLVISVWF
uniref:Semaphorin-7A n=2 Tax=Fundulus heteroclitus TaxID=8078 RepID=A0A3Q2QMT8_FUNHE